MSDKTDQPQGLMGPRYPNHSGQEFGFGSFRLLTGRRELLLHGAPIQLGSRAFEVLVALIRRPGQLVTKEELLTEVWLGRIVEENNLQAQISAVRKVLGRDADSACHLQTIPGHGYRFVGRVTQEASSEDIGGFSVVLRKSTAMPQPSFDKPTIAVIPFANLSSDPQQKYFSDGITDDIVTELSRFSELIVLASNSSFKLRGSALDIREAGNQLGISYVLEGSIRKAGERVRITAKLVDLNSGAHRWVERYDREMNDVFAVQDEVAQAIASILAAHVSKDEVGRTLMKPPAAWQVYDHYLLGREAFSAFLASYKVRDLYNARRHLHSALAIDGSYARAHAVLSNIRLCAYIHPLDGDYLSEAALEAAHEVARKAVQLAPYLTVAHEHLGLVLTFMGRHDEAVAEFEKAAALNPNFSNWRFGLALVHAGESERAIRVSSAITRLDPFYPAAAAGFFGFAYYMLKRYAEALPWLLECTSRAPDFRVGHTWLAATYAQLGHAEGARKAIADVLRLDPTFTIQGKQRRLKPFRLPGDAQHFFDGLRKAGLPER